MATIRLTILSSIKEQDGRLPILVCISQKKDRTYTKTEFLLDDKAEFNNGKVAYRKDANIINKRLEFVFSQYKEKFDSINDIEYFSAIQIKQIITSKERPSHISFIEFWKKRIDEFKEEGRESYAKMNEETIRIFFDAEGDVPIPAINTLIIEHFRKWMAKKGYANGNIGLRLTHLKARINELIKIYCCPIKLLYDRKLVFFKSYSLFEAHIRAFKNILTSFSIYFILSKKTSPHIANILEMPI